MDIISPEPLAGFDPSSMVKNVLTTKDTRKLDHALNRFFNPKAWRIPTSIEDFSWPNSLARELRLSGNRILLLTDIGIESFQTITTILDAADISTGLASYSDIANACRKILEKSLSACSRPADAAEFIEQLCLYLRSEIEIRTFAVPVIGIELQGIEDLTLGEMGLIHASLTALDARGVDYAGTEIESMIPKSPQALWLVGDAEGTRGQAEMRFREKADLMIGVIAMAAGSICEQGALPFRIGLVMSPAEAYGRSGWLSWPKSSRKVTTHLQFIKHQNLKIDSSLREQLMDSPEVRVAINSIATEKRTELQEAIVKALYWYAEAHRDAIPTMQLVKYWSCVETFFSTDSEKIVHSVSVGLTAVLVFSGFGLVAVSDYASTKKKITELYKQRSKAVHRASYQHVSTQDVAMLSKYVSWMLIGLLSLVDRGYSKLVEIKQVTERLDQQMKKA